MYAGGDLLTLAYATYRTYRPSLVRVECIRSLSLFMVVDAWDVPLAALRLVLLGGLRLSF